MNNMYSWHDEMMVAVERQEINHEIENIRLIHDASLSNPGLIERIGIALGKALVRVGQRIHEQYTSPHQAYQVTSGKFAA